MLLTLDRPFNKLADFITIIKVPDRLPLQHTGLNLSILHELRFSFFLQKTVSVCSNNSKWKFINHSLGKQTNIYWK